MRLSRVLMLAVVGGALVTSAVAQEERQYPDEPPQTNARDYPQPDQGYPPPSYGNDYPQEQYPNYPSGSQYPDYPAQGNSQYPQQGNSQYPGYPEQGYPQEQTPYPPQSQYPNYPPQQDGGYSSQYPPNAPPPQGGYYPPPRNSYPPAPPAQQPMWLPQGVEALGQYASSRTEFTLDHDMLVFASKFDQDNVDLQRVIAGVRGVSVHSFRFPDHVACDPRLIASIKRQYHDAGFQHLVSKRPREYGGVATDLWLHLEHGAITDIAVLFQGERQLNFVSVAGSISPVELLHLGGHFGIPRIEGGAEVPAPYGKKHDRDWDRYDRVR